MAALTFLVIKSCFILQHHAKIEQVTLMWASVGACHEEGIHVVYVSLKAEAVEIVA